MRHRFGRWVFHSIPFRTDFQRWPKLRAFRRMVGQLEPEVIHSYSFYTNFAAYQAAWGTGTVAVGSVRSDFVLDKTGNWPVVR